MKIPIAVEVRNADLLLGVVEVRGVVPAPSPPELVAEIEAAIAARAGSSAGEGAAESPVRSAVRDLLRKGGYKPTGRGKPAAEYLAQAAARGEFPRINNLVDALNLVSLETGLPISMPDTDLALEGCSGLVVRLGLPGERYVFNAAGQEIDVAGLLGIAREGGAMVAGPVKDSLATKTRPETHNALAIVWATRRVVDEDALATICARLARLFEVHAGATSTETRNLDARA